MNPTNPAFVSIILGAVINIIGVGIYIGVVKSTLSTIKDEIKDIKKDMTTHSEEISMLRERTAVAESKIDNLSKK